MAKSHTIDVWSQINGWQQFAEIENIANANSKAEVLKLGHSHRDEVFKYCGLRASKVKWRQRKESDFPGAEKCPYAQIGELYLFFDSEMRWQGLNWEPQSEGQSLVTWAALNEDAVVEDEDVIAGRLRLLVSGEGIKHHAVLPDFIFSLSAHNLDFKLRAINQDKWLQLTTKGSTGTLVAEFTLRALKARFESRFAIDYCMNSLTLLAPELAQWSA